MYYTIWKRPFNIRFEKKKFYSAGAWTHESETRPEKICGNESLGEIELFSYKYSILGKTSYEDSNTGLEASSFPSKIGMLLCLTKLLSDLYGSGTGVQGPAPQALLPASHYE